jgi:hypothetical protein
MISLKDELLSDLLNFKEKASKAQEQADFERKMRIDAENKVDELENENKNLKRTLAEIQTKLIQI